ncbi:hypothetical protein HOK31_05195 [Candidatus Poribacteria bacterium]|nr:hypothetical protein [Candidatus Poribacteria bacterium]
MKDKARHGSSSYVTLRSVVIGALLIPICVYWVTLVETRYYSLDGSCLPLFVQPVFFLFLLTLLNLAAQRYASGHALSSSELLVIYFMNAVSVTFSGHDMFQNMFGAIVHAKWNATPENEWAELFWHYIPDWLTVSDPKALAGFYEGESTIYAAENFRPWLVPLAFWGAFVLVLMFMMLCINTIVRKRWTEHEKLAYPNIQLPMRLAEGGGAPLLRQRALWLGVSVAAFITVLNGLHHVFPQVPYIKYIKQVNVGSQFTAKPWNALAGMTVSGYPFMIGLSFFMPLDLSFSCWFFYVIRRLEQVAGAAAGFRSLPAFPYFGQQGWGAWLTLCGIAVWSSRRQIRSAFHSAIRPGLVDDTNEPLPYRWAWLGLAGGGVAVLVFTSAAGMAAWVSVVFFGIYFALSFAITRVRAEFGSPHEIYYVNPHDMMISALGSRAYPPRSQTMLAMFYWFNRGYRNHPMPNQLEAFKMAEGAGIRNRGILGALLVAIAVSIVATFWANLHIAYINGAESLGGFKDWVGRESFTRLQRWFVTPTPASLPHIMFAGAGSILVLLMTAMRARFLWWPFHPAGYALAVSFAMEYFWFVVFAGWALKLAILRHGGIRLHNRAIPFFLGLILGDYFFGSVWAIIGPALRISTYKIFI